MVNRGPRYFFTVPMVISTWNIWGLNQPQKQKEVQLIFQKKNVDVFGCLETRMMDNKINNYH